MDKNPAPFELFSLSHLIYNVYFTVTSQGRDRRFSEPSTVWLDLCMESSHRDSVRWAKVCPETQLDQIIHPLVAAKHNDLNLKLSPWS